VKLAIHLVFQRKIKMDPGLTTLRLLKTAGMMNKGF